MCSFCLRSRAEAGVLVGAPTVGICRKCTEAALVLFQNSAPEAKSQQRAPWDSMDNEELLGQLPKVAKARDDVENHLRIWVGVARSRKISWASIGESLGMSRQSAWERFHQSVVAEDESRRS
ncbi:ClpX C4-type zinc finger protein [Glutamicibacter sp. AOP5-A2-18]|uniref:ClpX C4-type zinc finger protein n=1 Tax=Glutamicibacter sp. AOP5-A2-18 TaxID=3457656 RepID=UPI004033E55F